jgi:hypothetical protein
MGWGMRQMSARREAEQAERKRVVAAAKRRDGYSCVGRHRVPEVRCGGPLDAHEIIPRSAWRGGYLVLDNVATVCRNHHDWIDDHPDDAHAVGLHGYSYERKDER